MKIYLLQYKRYMQEKTENKDDYDKNLMKEFDTFVNSLDLDKKGFMVSYCRDTINDKLNKKLSNQQVKQLLIGF